MKHNTKNMKNVKKTRRGVGASIRYNLMVLAPLRDHHQRYFDWRIPVTKSLVQMIQLVDKG